MERKQHIIDEWTGIGYTQATGWSFVDKLYEDRIQRKINKINFDRMLGKYQQEGLLAEKEKLERGYGCSV